MEGAFWNSTVQEIEKGFVKEDHGFTCLVCGEVFQEGFIFQKENTLMEAKKAVEVHVQSEHESMTSRLLGLPKKQTGLSDIQKDVLSLLLAGKSDEKIASELEFGSISTVRQYRFKFREKAKQAKVFLALMNAYEESSGKKNDHSIHKGAKMVDDRWVITEQEEEKVLKNYIDKQTGKLLQFPGKEKRKIVILKYIISQFEVEQQYKEKEVNELIKRFYEDFATLRRYLIEYGFMHRNKDGSRYWVERTLSE
ncbi:DUF2087 domain-containing protein [Alteribacter populi]|uniref:DUF2087 domain-containing protein n=1 Tax=Alteribacter populi TaxID=2011011 RepID=UPI000BBB3045|nr:DUF2087 domain-containing protein [Alteribacter populi]